MLALAIVAHFHESKASGPAGFAVGYEVDTVNRAVCFKHRSNRIFSSIEAEVSYKNILQLVFFLKFAEQRIEGRIGGVFSGLCEKPELAGLSNTSI